MGIKQRSPPHLVMFESIELAPADPILGLAAVYNADPNPNKINLGVGIYQNSEGRTPVLPSVKQAESVILEKEQTKSYLPIPGSAKYAAAVQTMLFGNDSRIVQDGLAFTAHTPGGTGALRVAGEFLNTRTDADTVWLTVPTWPNHGPIFTAAGLQTKTFNWFNAETNAFDLAATLDGIDQIPAGDIIVLHGCCHNPTGCDPTVEEWRVIAEKVQQRGLFPIVDFAYQGFAVDLEEDAAGLREIAKVCPEFAVCSSFSKNFGLYRERTGSLTFVTKDADTQKRLASQAKLVIRTNYSNPPSHGAAIVSTIFEQPELTAQWKNDLSEMRERIKNMRSLLVNGMSAMGASRDFSFVLRQNGMFSLLGLSKEQVAEMGAKHSVHMVASSRINIAGLNENNIEYFCKALNDVL